MNHQLCVLAMLHNIDKLSSLWLPGAEGIFSANQWLLSGLQLLLFLLESFPTAVCGPSRAQARPACAVQMTWAGGVRLRVGDSRLEA